MSNGFLLLVLGVDLGIFLFIWLVIAAWMRLFQFYEITSLRFPVVLGCIAWMLSFIVRYHGSSGPDYYFVVYKTIIWFMASISVIRLAVKRFGKQDVKNNPDNSIKVREILPTRLGEWIIMGTFLLIIMKNLNPEKNRVFWSNYSMWHVYLFASVFANLYISRKLWNLVEKVIGIRRKT